MDQGWTEYLASNYSNAVVLLQEAGAAAKPLKLPLLEATIEMRLGAVELRQGQMDRAERALRHVIEVSAAQHDPYLQAAAMGNLGVLYQNTFQFEEAVYWLDKAAAVFQQIGSVNFYYVTLGNLGWCYHRLGDSDRALQNFQLAEAHAHQIGDRYNEQLWIGNSGSVLYARDDFDGAAKRFKRALEISQSLGTNEKDSSGWWYYNLASTSIDLGDFNAAEAYNQEALRRRASIADHSDFYPRVNEAHIAAARHDPRAESLYRALIAEYHDGLNPVPMLEARAGLAELLAHKGAPKEAFDQADAQFRAALAQLESQRMALASADNRISYLSSLIRFYDRYLNFLVNRHQPERALEIAESSRARVLDERMQSKTAHTVVPASRLRDLAQASHSVFLSYWLGKRRSFLWAVTADGITLHELPPESQIAPLVSAYETFLENLRDPLKSEFPAGPKLSALLLDPVRDQLTNHVVLVPDRALHSLNFETLPDPADPSRYLIERTTLEVTPSLDVLAESRPAVKPAGSMLIIGDPDPAVEEFPRLPFAASEIDLISHTVVNQTVLRGLSANPEAYRDAHPEQFSWIHFAAHAAANQRSPLDSALILSRHADSYQLPAREIMNVPLNASLVTLSACRSAGAKTFSGEGQVGLAWAFLRAGARSVVAGLWDVTDRSTAQLMSDFYTQLAKNQPPAEALRYAKLALLHTQSAYAKPFYWAPFQLYAGALN
jgi:CHAT domain-containing protein/Flp pilus assembly protein TadD